MKIRNARRRAMAIMLVVVILAVLAAVTAGLACAITADRQILDNHQHRLQATWLARSGLELACSRLLAGAKDYTGGSVELIPKSQIRIEVHPEKDSPQSFLVTCTARYPEGMKDGVEITLKRHLKRVTTGGRVTIEVTE